MRVITVAAKDTGGQERASKQTEDVEDEFVDETSDLKDRHAKLSEDVDDVLDEIDEVGMRERFFEKMDRTKTGSLLEICGTVNAR